MKRIKVIWELMPSLRKLQIMASMCVFVQFLAFGIEFAPDSQSYIDAWENHYGILDLTRTPVYPIVIGLTQLLFSDVFLLVGIAFVQYALFLLSVKWFYQLTQMLLPNSRVSFIISLVYTLHPCINGWCIGILTESLSISLMVGFLFYIYRVVTFCYIKDMLITSSLIFLLVFLRPAFVYILPTVLFIYLMLSFCSKKFLIGFVGSLIVCCSLLLYMAAFQNLYGAFTSSRIGTANQYYSARQYGYMEVPLSSSIEFKEYVENSIHQYGEIPITTDFLSTEAHRASILFSLSEVNEAISITIKKYPDRFITSVCRRIAQAAMSPLFECMNIRLSFISTVIGPSIGTLLLFTLIFLFYCFSQIMSKEGIPYFSLLLVMIIWGNFLVSSLGSYQAYGRLCISSVPCALILFAHLYLRIAKNRLLS